jgi:hypothetical protein
MLDAGTALLNSDVGFRNYAWRIGAINSIAAPVPGMNVVKHGRSAGRTCGMIIDVKTSTNSGAPIITGDGVLVGILHADYDGDAYAINAGTVFAKMMQRRA